MIFLWWSLCLSVPVEQSRWQGDRGVPVAVMAALAPVFCKLNVRAAVPHPTVTQGRWSATKQAGFSAVCLQVTPTFLGPRNRPSRILQLTSTPRNPESNSRSAVGLMGPSLSASNWSSVLA